MSYDLAVWEGTRPTTNSEAKKVFEELMSEETRAKRPKKPSPAIAAYVRALLAKWPDITKDEDSPWADAPLMNNARGDVFYFAMVFSQAEEASTFAAALAKKQGLVCFDPQTGRLRPNDVDDKTPKKADANPKVKPADAARRVTEGITGAMRAFGLEPSRRNRFTQIEFVRKVDADYSVYLGWSLAAGSVRPIVSVDSQRVLDLLDAYVPVRKGSKRRTMFAFVNALYGMGWMEAQGTALPKKALETWFEDAVCHEKCVTAAIKDIAQHVARYGPPLVESLDSIEKLDAFYNGKERRAYEGNWEYVIPFASVIVASLTPHQKRLDTAIKRAQPIVKKLPSQWNEINVYFEKGSPHAAFEKLVKTLR